MPVDFPRLTRSAAQKPGIGIVHLGLGAFYRAHGAVYFSEAMQKHGGDWGIVGVSLQSARQHDLMAPQDFVYTAVELGPQGQHPQVIDVVQDVLVAKADPSAVLARLANPLTRIVTLTVTEKGYCHDPATGALNLNHPDIIHDLANPDAPVSALGYLLAALAQRHAAGTRPFTVVSCDNLPNNGKVLRGVLLQLAQQSDAALTTWIRDNGAFPSSMVDRIVPATKPEDIENLAQATGVLDQSPVMHEPFRQWVVEDTFVDGVRPDLASVGVQMVTDVTPFEHMKLRCLNGTHSALAYLGYLSGHETIAQTVADDVLANYCKALWKTEILPGLTAPEGVDLHAYSDSLFARYVNPSIRHLTWQIAMDGSQKLPQRLLATCAENLAAGRSIAGLSLAVAAWTRYVGGTDEQGKPIDVRDPLADTLRSLSDSAATIDGKVGALLGLRQVFSQELAENPVFVQAVTQAYARLMSQGARATVRETLQ